MTAMAETNTNNAPTMVSLPEPRADRPVKLVHHIELAAMRGLIALLRATSVDHASALVGKFLRIIGPLIRPVSKRAEKNLAKIYPDWSNAELSAVMRDLWENLGRTSGEFAHLDKLTSAGRLEISGAEHLEHIKSSGKPVIFVTGHFANWELTPVALQAAGVNYGFVYRPANNPLTDEFIINHRATVMSRHQIPKGGRGGRALVKSFEESRSVLMLVDQKLNTGISVPFMGKPAMTAPAAARLSLKYDVPLVYLSLERLNGVQFRMTAHAPIAFSPTGNSSDDIYALTMQVNELLEKDIRARPAQWLWFHRRWPKN